LVAVWSDLCSSGASGLDVEPSRAGPRPTDACRTGPTSSAEGMNGHCVVARTPVRRFVQEASTLSRALVRAAEFDQRATVVRYFCDWCGQETSEDDVRVAWVLVRPDPSIKMEICSECAKNAAAFASGEQLLLPVFKRRRLSRRGSVPELARGDGEEGRSPPSILSTTVTRAATPLLRALLYLAVAGTFFYLVTFFTAR